MEKAVLSGDRVIRDGHSYGMEGIKCVISTDIGTSVTFRSGESVILNEDFYKIADLCPWAVKC